jgi:hypothetical protein
MTTLRETVLDAAQWLEHANHLLAKRDLPSAHAAFHQAETLGAPPDPCCGGRWFTAMLAGNFEAAWHECDALRHRNAPDPHRFWNGQSIVNKHLIVRALHGFGDAVQMLRYAPLLERTAASVLFEVPPRFVEIAPYFRGVQNVVTWGEQASPTPPIWDLQLEIMELPYVFRTASTDLPIATDYLDLPASLLHRTTAVMHRSSKPRIGLVWAGGDWNLDRAIPFSLLGPLLNDPRFELWNLQGGHAADEGAHTIMQNATELCGDGILSLAGTIAHLDLIITVDTLAAHLAGAIGKPVWLLLQYAADWRWMMNCTDSAWYPSMRLFRQPRPGDWPGVITNVVETLRDYAF